MNLKMEWKRGRPPGPGVYLVWNPAEDSRPAIMHCDITDSGHVWWTYRVAKAVLVETLGVFFAGFAEAFVKSVSAQLILAKRQKGLLQRLVGFLDAEIDSAIDEALSAHQDCVYDTGPPEFWCELPYLWDERFEAQGQETDLTGDPNDFGAEVADIQGAVISRVAEVTERAIAHELQRIKAPWVEETAPWARSDAGEA